MNHDVQTAGRAMRQNARAPDASRYDAAALTPPGDVIEDVSGITLYADLPGVPREGLNLHVKGATLTIDAESSLRHPKG